MHNSALLTDTEPKWGPTGREVYERTYSRVKPDGTMETWADTVQRVVDGNLGLVDERFHKEGERERLYDLMYRFKLLPAGRHLWTSGVPGRQFNRNCHVSGWGPNLSDHFTFTFDELMKGGGVGANYSSSILAELPRVKRWTEAYYMIDPSHPDAQEVAETVGDFLVGEGEEGVYVRIPDTREGWVDAMRTLIEGSVVKGSKNRIIFDLSGVRPRGSLIKGFGGTASGPAPLASALMEAESVLNTTHAYFGGVMTPLLAMGLDHAIAQCVVAGNVRRSARMSILHWKDKYIFDFINCKADQSQHWTTNISVEVDDEFFDSLENGDPHAVEVFERVTTAMLHNGEPGFFNSSLASVGEKTYIRATNPCLTGDTMVAVADGRGKVSIGELAEAGEDVPVYTFDPVNKEVTVRTMRNPRKTGFQQEILEVLLDSGDTIRVTPNHKFVLRDGTEVEAQHLQGGESLRLMTRYQSSFVPGGPRQNRQPYWNIASARKSKGEHRLIHEFHTGEKLGSDMVVHHKDFCATNNHPSNLEAMTTEEHDAYHASLITGNNNPMYRGFVAGEFGEEWQEQYREGMSVAVSGESNPHFSGFSNDSLRELALRFTREAGRKLSTNDWERLAEEHGLPKNFSSWRRSSLGTVGALLSWAAGECGFPTHVDPRTDAAIKKWADKGYDVEYTQDGSSFVFVHICEECDATFRTKTREHGLCSIACANKQRAAQTVERRRQTGVPSPKTQRILEQRIAEGFDAYINEQGRLTYRHICEWCKEVYESPRRENRLCSNECAGAKRSADRKDAEAMVNHKVVSVVHAGFEDVYNGTVDEFHTFFVGGWDGTTASGNPKECYILNRQCGEIALEDWESCNLGHVNLAEYADDHAGALEAFALVARFLVRATFAELTNPRQVEVEARNRRIGVGFFGFQEWLGRLGIKFSEAHNNAYVASALQDFKQEVIEAADAYADELGIPRPVKHTTLAPTGSIAKLPGTTEGGHPVYSRYYERRVRYAADSPKLADLAKDHDTEDCIYSANTKVVVFHVKDTILDNVDEEIVEQANEISIDDMLAVQRLVQTHYADNAVSFTANVDPSLPVEELRAALRKHLPFLKGTTIMPDESRQQAPYTRITREEYEKAVDHTTGQSFDECASGACPIR